MDMAVKRILWMMTWAGIMFNAVMLFFQTHKGPFASGVYVSIIFGGVWIMLAVYLVGARIFEDKDGAK